MTHYHPSKAVGITVGRRSHQCDHMARFAAIMRRHMRGAATLASIALGSGSAQGQAPNEAPAIRPDGGAAAATLRVENGLRLEPPEWHLSIAWSGGSPLKTGQPHLQYFARNQAGEWQHVSAVFAGSDFSLYPSNRESMVSGMWCWVVDPGESIEFVGELADWRVIGFPGTYKALVRLPGLGDIWSEEFSIARSGSVEHELAGPLVGNAEESDALKSFMRHRLIPVSGLPESLRLLRVNVLGSDHAVSADDETARLLFVPGEWERRKLRSASGLPMAMHDRIELWRLLVVGRGMTFEASEDPRVVSQAAEWASKLAAMGTKPGHVGRVARYQWLVYAKQANVPGCDDLLAAARLDPMMRGVAASYMEGAVELGMFPKLDLAKGTSHLCPTGNVLPSAATGTTGPAAPKR